MNESEIKVQLYDLNKRLEALEERAAKNDAIYSDAAKELKALKETQDE